jgi:uncharacterized membrane protein
MRRPSARTAWASRNPPQILSRPQVRAGRSARACAGVITGAADDDLPHSAPMRAQERGFSLGLLWIAPVLLPMVYVVVYVSEKLGQVYGKGPVPLWVFRAAPRCTKRRSPGLARLLCSVGKFIRSDRRSKTLEAAMVSSVANAPSRQFPTSSGILFGLGLGGFFDGIVLHQILQWHHMVTSAGYPADSVDNLRFNTLLDGLFHASTYIFVVLGLILLWRAAHRSHLWWSGKLLAGTLLIGFGAFNLVEGIVDHQILGLHHVNETVARENWIYWDVGFLIWGAAMVIAGTLLFRAGKRQSPGERA